MSAAVEQVVEAPGRRDDDVEAGTKHRDLAVHRRTAKDGGDPEPAGGGQGRQRLRDLIRELARRRKHERVRRVRLRGRVRSTSGMPNASVLPEPVRALPQMSLARQRVRDRQRLDRERISDARLSKGRDEDGGKAEVFEGHARLGECLIYLGSVVDIGGVSDIRSIEDSDPAPSSAVEKRAAARAKRDKEWSPFDPAAIKVSGRPDLRTA